MQDQSLQPVFSALRSLLIVLGAALAAHGYGDSGFYQAIQFAAGSVMVAGPAVWGVWVAVKNYRTTHALASVVSPGNPKGAIAAAKAGTL